VKVRESVLTRSGSHACSMPEHKVAHGQQATDNTHTQRRAFGRFAPLAARVVASACCSVCAAATASPTAVVGSSALFSRLSSREFTRPMFLSTPFAAFTCLPRGGRGMRVRFSTSGGLLMVICSGGLFPAPLAAIVVSSRDGGAAASIPTPRSCNLLFSNSTISCLCVLSRCTQIARQHTHTWHTHWEGRVCAYRLKTMNLY
jgi:hypothetical protein